MKDIGLFSTGFDCSACPTRVLLSLKRARWTAAQSEEVDGQCGG